jgi:filamentous hemagglutinin family protein
MNRNCYRLVFNRQRNGWLAVAETVRGRGKKSTRRTPASATAVLLGLTMALAGSALAGPTIPAANALPVPSSGSRPFVFAGSVNGGQPSVTGNTMTITTPSRALGINWASFNIGSDASLTFNQPDATSRVLNRIWSADPSVIMGRLNANGEVYLINQNGILFGNGAQVNVGGLLASALNLSDSMASQLLNSGLPSVRGDRLEFAWDGSAAGFNAGFVTLDAGAKVSTPSGGRVLLIAPKTVENLGLIAGGGGAEAILAAGGKVILTAPDDPNLRGLLVETKSFTGKDSLGNNVSLDGSVSNKTDGTANNGRIDTGSGGVVTLAALAVNQKGMVKASKAINLNGTTMLVSGSTETNRLTINQRGERAEIDWVSSFNVGTGKTVEFVQQSPGAIAYNYVYDPDRTASDGMTVLNTAGRSSIDGTLKANGQLALINENGIDFGSNARVAANNFVASALGINPDVVASGLLMQDGVKARAFYLNKTPAADSAETRQAALDAFRKATIDVKAGATIDTASNGYVILAGAKVRQAGTITTPHGQALLAAGADLYLKPAYSAALRGFSAEVNPLYVIGASTAGIIDPWIALSRGADANAVINTGRITATLGNITLVGHEITQAGTLTATTSSTANGSIRMLARDQVNDRGLDEPVALKGQRLLDSNGIAAYVKDEVYDSNDIANQPEFTTGKVGGALTLAAGSTTQVLLDGSDGKTLSADQSFISSSIEAAAKQIVVAGRAGATPGAVVEAKGGRIQFLASESFDLRSAFAGDPVSVSQATSAPAGVGVFVADGARLDVSGVTAKKSVSDLFIKVELRGDEFANNPVQRNRKLRGKTAWVDIRENVAIADLSGWISKIGQTVEEKAATGGTISFKTTGSVIVKPNAELNVSGGGVEYAGGTVTESRVLSIGGKSYRLNDAPTSAIYYGIRERKRKLADYYEGRSAGTLEFVGHGLAVDGKLIAHTTRGSKQRNINTSASDHYAVPLGGKLIIADAGQHFPVGDRDTASEEEKMREYSEAQIAFVKRAANASANLEAGDSAGRRLELSQSLVDAGFSRFDIKSDGRIDVGTDVALDLAPGGEFKLSDRQVHVAGKIKAPNGKITLTTRDMSTADGLFPTLFDAKYSTLVVDSGGSLSTAGQWVNDYVDRKESSHKPKATNGGNISLESAYDIDLREGSQLNVSGGALVNGKGKVEAGNAGSIVMTTGGIALKKSINGDLVGGFDFLTDLDRRDAGLYLNGTLSAYALGSGGSLDINTSSVLLGDHFAADSRDWSRTQRLAENQVGVALTSDFFNNGGFYDFKLVGRDGVTVKDGTRINAQPVNWSLLGSPNYRRMASGTELASFANSVVLHPELRSSTTDLTLATRSLNFGDIIVGDGAYLGVSPKGSINLESSGKLIVFGAIEAPAGSIKLSRPAVLGNDPYNRNESFEYSEGKQSESIYLGSNSRLLASGTTVLSAATRRALESGASAESLRDLRRYKGEVMPGGNVSIDAGRGYLITRSGSLIDVSGTTDRLNSATALNRGVGYKVQTLGSAGGSVSLAAREGMFLDGGYRAAGGSNALGGTFALRFADTELKSNPWELLSSLPPGLSEQGKAAMIGVRELTLYQAADAHTELWLSTGLSAVDAAAYLAGSATLDPAQFNGKAALDLAPLQAAGFGSWYLASQDAMRFSGTISATVNNQLRLDAASFSAASDASRLALKAAAAQIGNFSVAGSAVPASIGAAQSTIEALDIGLVGTFSWNGFGSSRFVSNGEMHFDSIDNVVAHREGGRLFNGQMSASGKLELSAARLSPGTYSDFRVDLLNDPDGRRTDGRIAITRPANAVADVSLSPAGRLEFAATTIDHQGTVTAPLGEIVFNAPGGSVTLASGSLTSVAADRDLMFGYTIESGTKWKYDSTRWDKGSFGISKIESKTYDIVAAPAKSIRIDAATSTLVSGAKLDLSGGGEAVAAEFSAGPGGKSDALQGSTTVFAIVPGWNGFSSTDSQLQKYYNVTATGSSGYSSVPSLKAGDSISLAANRAGVSGTYVLLPARYALLPGAYLLTVKTTDDGVLNRTKTQADGSLLVSGTRLAVNADGSTTPYSQRALTLELATSSVTAKRAKYITTTASEFFYDTAGVNLPGDAGQLTAIGRNSLVFDPAIVAMRQAEIAAADGRARAGRGLELDLAAPKLLITDNSTAPDASWSVLDQTKLNALGASSLLLGGVKTVSGATTHIDTIATNVQIRNSGSALTGSELMATASESLTVTSGSHIDTMGSAEARTINLAPATTGDNYGAFLRVAEGGQASVSRVLSDTGSVIRTKGDLNLEAGSFVAGNSLIFDATHTNLLNGSISLGKRQSDGARGSGGAITIGAGRINVVGDGSTPADGLTLGNNDIASFSRADQLRLTSYTTLDLYGNATLGTTNLRELVIGAAGIAGHGNDAATIAAKSVVFGNPNPSSAKFTNSGLGSGTLNVDSENITFATNVDVNSSGISDMRSNETTGFAMRGFSQVNLTSTGDLRFVGKGVTVVDNAADNGLAGIDNVVHGGNGTTAALSINAGRVVTAGTADHLLTASGATTVRRNVNAGSATSDAGLGGNLELRAKSLDVSGTISAAAGKLTLAGTDHVRVLKDAYVAAEGVKVAFDDTYAYAPGGSITLKSDTGSVSLDSGAVVSVSADAKGGDAGTISLVAQNGMVSAATGTLRGSAASTAQQGALKVDAHTVGLDTLVNAVTNADGKHHLAGNWDIRARAGNLNLSKTITAENVTIAADNGGITVGTTGVIDASGSKGGKIGLYVRNGDVVLDGQLQARAREVVTNTSNAGTRGQGGQIELSASGTGKVLTSTGSVIDVGVADGSAATGGKVNFRAAGTTSTSFTSARDLNIQRAGTVLGASDVGAEIVKTFTATGNATLTDRNASTAVTDLALNGTSISNPVSSLFSQSNVNAMRSLLGFTGTTTHVRAGFEIISTGDLTIGNDINLQALRFADEAGVLTIRSQGNLKINGTLSDGFLANGSNTAVSRDAKLATSGQSWSYRLVAGADVTAATPLMTNAAASTGNLTLNTNKLVRTGTGSIDLAASKDIKLLDRAAVFTAGIAASTHPEGFSPITTTATSQSSIKSIFPDGGGNLSLTAGKRIVMVNADGATIDDETRPDLRNINQWLFRNGNEGVDLQWWPRIASFQQGVAAFGGGNIRLNAGTEIKNFTAFIPTNGRVPTIAGVRQPDLAVVQGGGDLMVHAGGTINGGLFYAETGQLRIDAAALAADVGVALGNTTARVVVAGDAALGNVFNPMWASSYFVVNQGQNTVTTSNANYTNAARFGTYSAATSFDLVSVSGNVALNSSDSFFLNSSETAETETLRLAPSRFKVAALNGNIGGTSGATIAQAPGENGQLDLLASGSINFGTTAVRQLDVPAVALPSVRNPLPGGSFKLLSLMQDGTALQKHSPTAWHSDTEPSRVIALNGDINGQGGASNFAEFNEAVRVEAGGNITDLSVVTQHGRSNDVSLITARGDIKYNVDGGELPSLGIALSGSGRLEVAAGGSIDLGDSRGIVTRGKLDNPYLPENGASIFALAGATPDYAAFRNYLKVGGEVSEAGLRERFYTLLRNFGREAIAGGGEASYEKGRAMIRTLFPQANITGGDINLFASQIKTEQGGGIDLLVPGGSIVVGVADPSIKKRSAVQGLFTLRDGDIRAYVKNNFLVNQSRVFTLDGGNILVWADTGSIDAGSGAKTVSSTPPPALVIRNGQIVLDTSNSVSGSGIGVLASRDDTPASDMDLFAPQGAIDAGDAGLRSTGNITLGAQTILNASNIQAAGTVSGAPAPAASAAPAPAPTSPTNTEKGDAQAASALASNRETPLGVLTVEVLESGEAAAEPAAEKDEEKKKKR